MLIHNTMSIETKHVIVVVTRCPKNTTEMIIANDV